MANDKNNVGYLTDEKGRKSAVVIPLAGNERAVREFLEDLYGHRVIKARKTEPTLSKEQLLRGLRRAGRL